MEQIPLPKPSKALPSKLCKIQPRITNTNKTTSDMRWFSAYWSKDYCGKETPFSLRAGSMTSLPKASASAHTWRASELPEVVSLPSLTY